MPGVLGWLILASLALLVAAAQGQQGVPRFEQLSVEDGLSHSTVWSILQDRWGFLWFASQEGLNRYDGYAFEVFRHDPEDPGSLADNEAYTLLVDRHGELWVGTFGGGLDRWIQSEERFEHYRHRPNEATSLSHDVVQSLLEDRNGSLWVGTEDGLDRLDRASGDFVRYHRSPTGVSERRRFTVNTLLEDSSGDLWIGAVGGLYRLTTAAPSPGAAPAGEIGTVQLYSAHGVDTTGWGGVGALLEEDGGILWLGTGDGLKRLSVEDGELEHYRRDPSDPESKEYIQSLYRDRTGELWVGTVNQGLARFDRGAGDLQVFRHDPLDPESLSDNSVLSIFEDSSGILWFSGYVGVNKFDRRRGRFGSHRQRPGRDQTLSSRSLWALLEDSAGELWVGTYASGLDRLGRDPEGGGWQVAANYPPDPDDPGSLPNGTVSALHQDRSGTLWVGTWGGICRFDRKLERCATFRHDPSDPSSLGENTVYTIHEDRSGRLWVGTYGGLNRMERATESFVRYPSTPDEPAVLGETPIFSILEDSRGALWFGSDRDGLFRLESGRFRHFRHDPANRDSLSGDKIAALYEDGSGLLWVGTYGAGLTGLDSTREKYWHYRRKDGLPSDSVLGILEDERGRLWLSTTYGLSRFDPQAESFRNYDAADGLQGNVYSTGSAFRGPSGELFFGGIRGFDAFFPDRIEDDPQVPAVAITDFLLFNRPATLGPGSPLESSILVTREIELSHRDYVFGFEFAALHFASPHKNRYAYRLEGFDRDWVATDAGQRVAQYSNLRPGDYTFRVRASNADRVWNEEGAAIEVTVRPSPWRTWWAYVLYFGALAAALAAYWRSHRRKLERERRRADRELRINRQLRRADRQKSELIAELEAKNVELERFTYTVSHDLKSPLVTIRGFLGLLRQDCAAGNEQRLEHDLERIEAAAAKMTSLLDDLLRLSRVGRQVNTMDTVAIDELAADAVGLLAGEIAERGVEVEIMPRMPLMLGDSTRLIQVLQNLIHNAVKYMGSQTSPRIEVGFRPGTDDEDDAVFFVRDNGIGIEPADRDKVFGLFERLEPSGEGTGVGLALVKRIIEVHGGRIWVESDGRFRGSSFCFTLTKPIHRGRGAGLKGS